MLRMTPKRKRVLSVLNNAESMLSAQDISRHFSDIDTATVYRSLDAFVNEGLVHKLTLDNGEALYEYISDPHHHVVCSTCNTVEHIHIPEKIVRTLPGMDHFKGSGAEIIIRGSCRKAPSQEKRRGSA